MAAAGVYVGMITRESVYWETATGLIAATSCNPPLISRFKIRPCGPYLDDGRNLLIEDYLKEPGTETTPWFVFLDSDVFARDKADPYALGRAIHELIAPGGIPLHGERFPVICGVYRNPAGGVIKPVTYDWEMTTDSEGVEHGRFIQHTSRDLASLPAYQHPLDAAPIHPDIAEVGAAGSGFMAIHRSLLLHMLDVFGYPQPWFSEPTAYGIHFGEDMGFCLRLGQLGVPVLVHRGVRLNHNKPVTILPG